MAPEVLSRTWSCITALASSTIWREGHAGDGREKLLLKSVLDNAEKNPQSVMRTIDQFARRSWLMNIGDDKGLLLDRAVSNRKPRVVLELGAYVGYSAVRIASQLDEGSKLISLEMSAENSNITRQVVHHAGLADKVQVVEGFLKDKVEEVQRLLQELNAKTFDFVFIDHDKNCYLPDFLILKEHGLVGKGTVLFADNMKIPGSPEYRDYVQKNVDDFETIEHKTRFEYFSWLPDSVVISTLK
uniref:catechol O-methyltransferase n=1 Tax=Plagiochasma appendiculatum TaxID=157224 RepID=A0A1P8NPM8_9MARC|nr:caffeoyl CoA O-methyltransferases [Plagiochasma appendiculatum]